MSLDSETHARCGTHQYLLPPLRLPLHEAPARTPSCHYRSGRVLTFPGSRGVPREDGHRGNKEGASTGCQQRA